MFASQSVAKRFLIDKIGAQAREEGAALSDAELWMLAFSESDPEFALDASRVQQFEGETSTEQFEAKIASLLRRRYQRDIKSDADVKGLYQDAYVRLQQGDHYVSVMLERALGAELRSARGSLALGSLRAVGLFVLLVLPACVATLMAMGLVVGLARRPAEPPGKNTAVVLGVPFLAGLAYYLIRLWRKESRRDVAGSRKRQAL